MPRLRAAGAVRCFASVAPTLSRHRQVYKPLADAWRRRRKKKVWLAPTLRVFFKRLFTMGGTTAPVEVEHRKDKSVGGSKADVARRTVPELTGDRR